MNFKKMAHIISILLIFGTILGLQPVAACDSKVVITNDDGVPINQITINRTQQFAKKEFEVRLDAMLFVDGEKRYGRVLDFIVTSKTTKETGYHEWHRTDIPGIAWGDADIRSWVDPEYEFRVNYYGSPDGEWPSTNTSIPIYIVN